MAMRNHDDKAVPLCRNCHLYGLHGFGNERLWWALQGVDPEEEARELLAQYEERNSWDI